MALSEKEHLDALRNQYQGQRDAIQRRAEELVKRAKERVALLNKRIRELDQMEADPNQEFELDDLTGLDQPSRSTNNRKRAPVSESIDRFLTETGKTEFTAAEVKHYLAGLGHNSRWMYNTIHETLTRRVKRGELIHEGNKFKVRKPDSRISPDI